MISYVLPTFDRPAVLARTVAALGRLPAHAAELIVADNASTIPVVLPRTLPNGVLVRVVRCPCNLAAAARNIASQHADRASDWLVMLDDDSYPLDAGHLTALADQPSDVGIVAAEVFLPGSPVRHEAGGLPEVHVGCGAAIRAELFRELGGYDPTFDYYAEEYDLAARVLLRGGRVVLDRRFRVLHAKEPSHRRFGRIVGNLVRNNAWTSLRYAPDAHRADDVLHHVLRYGWIACKERALSGYARGVAGLLAGARAQPRRAMTQDQWDRFTGLAAARAHLQRCHAESALGRVAVVLAGKHAHLVRRAIEEVGGRVIGDAGDAHTLVVGTLSPGPMLDGLARLRACVGQRGPRVLLPWDAGAEACAAGPVPGAASRSAA